MTDTLKSDYDHYKQLVLGDVAQRLARIYGEDAWFVQQPDPGFLLAFLSREVEDLKGAHSEDESEAEAR